MNTDKEKFDRFGVNGVTPNFKEKNKLFLEKNSFFKKHIEKFWHYRNKERYVLDSRISFKPFDYPGLYEGWRTQVKMFWTMAELLMDIDRKQYYEMSENEQRVIKKVLNFFTQTDVEVSRGYVQLLQLFKMYEIQSMLAAFCFMETIHAAAYGYLIDELKLPQEMFEDFVKYKTMADKYDYITSFKVDTYYDIARTIAFMSGFVEGFVIFSAFCILIRPNCYGKMKNLMQISDWSMRDENLHNQKMTELLQTPLTRLTSLLSNLARIAPKWLIYETAQDQLACH